MVTLNDALNVLSGKDREFVMSWLKDDEYCLLNAEDASIVINHSVAWDELNEEDSIRMKKIYQDLVPKPEDHMKEVYTDLENKVEILDFEGNILTDNINTQDHYKGSTSLYKVAEDWELNSYEFDIVKRIVRCRFKGDFKRDLEKTKDLIDIYLAEYGEE